MSKLKLHPRPRPPIDLITASKAGDADLVKMLLAAGVDKEERDEVSFHRHDSI